MRSSAAAPARSTAATRPSSITSAASRTIPSGPSPSSGSLVTRQADVVERRACSRGQRSDRARRARRRRRARGACRRDDDSARRTIDARGRRPRLAAKTTASSACAGAVPARRTQSRPTVTRSAIAPGSIRPASGQPIAAWPAAVAAARAGRRRGGGRARPVASRSSSSTARASSKRSMTALRVGAEAERRAGVGEPPRRADAVGEVALGGRAEAAGRPRLAEAAEVGVGEVGGVDRGEALAERPGLGEQRRRGRAVRARHASFSAGCSETWACSGAARSRAQAATRRGRRVDRADAVDRGADPRPARSASRSTRSAQASALPSEKRRCASSGSRRCRRAGSRRRAA